MSDPPSAQLPLRDLAALVLLGEREAKRAAEACAGLRAELLARMQDDGVPKIELEGAPVAVVEPTTAETLDGDAARAKIGALGARLRDLGQRDVDDTVPTKPVRRGASLRVTARL